MARTSREGDRDEQAVGAASSITLRNGACLVQKPSNLPTVNTTTVDPPRCRQHSHWAIWRGLGSVEAVSTKRVSAFFVASLERRAACRGDPKACEVLRNLDKGYE